LISVPVQVNGRLRTVLEVSSSTPEADLKQIALNHERVINYIGTKEIKHVVVVPRQVINIVV
jgi:leucyl-tRNA synthetase